MEEVDKFKESFKLFKKLSVQDLRAKVVDLRDSTWLASEVNVIELSKSERSESVTSQAACLGLRPPHQWRVYGLSNVPGLLVVLNPFLDCGQHHWVRRCLVDYPLKPNVCNLDAHMTRPGSGQLWPHPQPQNSDPPPHGRTTQSEPCSKKKFDSHSIVNCDSADKDSDPPHSSNSSSSRNFSPHIDTAQSMVSGNAMNPAAKKMKLSAPSGHDLPTWLSKESLLYKLRWVTLGYHYDWSRKEYSLDNKSIFPEDLQHLSSFVLRAVGFPDFQPEAAIVNYYHLDSTLSGHTDHSEKDLSCPLLSISLGQSAVFLIGGPTKQTSPLPLLLNSGDIVMMSGESRLAYHGIPRVLPPSPGHPVPDCLTAGCLVRCTCSEGDKGRTHSPENCSSADNGKSFPGCAHDGIAEKRIEAFSVKEVEIVTKRCCHGCSCLADLWHTFVDYLSVSRINVNVRQVVSENFSFGT